MNVLKALLLVTTSICVVAMPASAGYYIAGGGSYGFGFTGFSYPTTSTLGTTSGTTTSGGTSTLNTSSCLFNNCSSTTPTSTTTPTTSSTSTAALTTSSFGGTTYTGYGFFGSYTRYSVFGMYNVQNTGPLGSTQTPTLSGGLTPTNVLGDPLANPEPTSVALFGAGLLALGWARRRKLQGKR